MSTVFEFEPQGFQMTSSEYPIIIGGSHRSGTTLLRRILNAQQDIFCPPEVKLHKDLLCQFPNDPLRYGRLGESIKSLEIPQEIWLDEFTKAYANCMAIAASKHHKRRWADKNPENALNIEHWSRALRRKLFFVMVIRDPRDILVSMLEAKMDKVIPPSLEGKMQHIQAYISVGYKFFVENPDISYLIRYEDIVTEPRRSLSSLFSWINADFSLDSLYRISDDAHGRGLEDPKISHENAVHSKSLGRWKNLLDQNDIDISSIAKPLDALVRFLGYD